MPVSRMEQQRRRLYEMCAMAIAAGRADLDGASRVGFDIDLPVFSVCLLYTSDAADEY